MSTRPILYGYFSATAQVLLAEFQRSSQQESPANLGRNREHFCSEFLAKILPAKLSVKKGEIWDSHNNRTGQLDVIITRDDCPCLHIGSDNIYLAEGVFGVIEVKSDLTSAKLLEAGESLDNVRNLSMSSGVTISSGPVLNRPLRIVFAFTGATWETLMETMIRESLTETFDLICILDRGIFIKNGLGLLIMLNELPYNIITGKAAALGFLYLHLLGFSVSFLGRNLPISGYFDPINNWSDAE